VLELKRLYPWLRDNTALPQHFYLNAPFFTLRILCYLLCWGALAYALHRELRTAPSQRARRRLSRLAPVGLIVLVLTISFAAIDLTMSLDTHFVSSAYGLIELSQCALLAMAAALLGYGLSGRRDGVDELGRLLFALVLLWAYLDFMQWLIIWQSDLASDAPWYALRLQGLWGSGALLIALLHFVLPFLLLLRPALRRRPEGIAAVSALLILGSVLRGWWLVLPAGAQRIGIIDVLAVLALAGLGSALALHRWPRAELQHG
jgi:hypothetical protein